MRRAARVLLSARSVALVGHENPDGDCLGSMLGLYQALAGKVRRRIMVVPGAIPLRYRFLPQSSRIRRARPEGIWDLVVYLDVAVINRAAGIAPECNRVLNIDHHMSNPDFGDINWVEGRTASVGQMIWRLTRQLKVPVTPAMATCLYTAVLTDTGSARYRNTSVQSLEAMSRLVLAGASPHKIARQIYFNHDAGVPRLLGHSLKTLKISADGLVAWMTVTQTMLSETGTTLEDTENFIDHCRGIRGVRVAMLIKETPGSVRVSIRAESPARADKIAAVFGGGGHRAAAGCVLTDDLVESTALIVAEAEKQCAAKQVIS